MRIAESHKNMFFVAKHTHWTKRIKHVDENVNVLHSIFVYKHFIYLFDVKTEDMGENCLKRYTKGDLT